MSGLVLNFLPDRAQALSEMMRVLKDNGTAAFYVWDYPGGGVEFMRAFWEAATSLDPNAVDLTEDRRFPNCTESALVALAREAGFKSVSSIALEAPTHFRDFDDLWYPFTLGAGPAPGYCVSLEDGKCERLKETLRSSLPTSPEGSITLKVRAWAVQGRK